MSLDIHCFSRYGSDMDIIGKRVELAPYTDRWMRGDRYGMVVESDGVQGMVLLYKVRMDRSGKTITVASTNFKLVNP